MTIDINNSSASSIKKGIDGAQSNQFQFLTEYTTSAIFAIQDQKILYANPAAESLTGLTKKELLGIDFFELFSGDHKNQIRELGTPANQGKSTISHGEYRIFTKDKVERWIDLTISSITIKNKQAQICTVFDVTEHKHGDVLQDAVYRIALAVDQSKKLEDLFSAVHEIIAEVMNADNFYIAIYDEGQKLLSFPYFVDEADLPPIPGKLGKGLTEYVLRSGKSQLVDLAMHEELYNSGEIELVGVPSPIWLGVPLIVDSEVIGAMVVQNYSDPNIYGEREKKILEFVSSQVAMAINRKRFEDAIKESEERYHRHADELTALYETGRDLASQQDLNTLLGTVAERISKLLKSHGCTIYLFNEGRQELEGVITTDLYGMRSVTTETWGRDCWEGGANTSTYSY